MLVDFKQRFMRQKWDSLLKKHSVGYNLVHSLVRWLFHDRALSTWTPRYLAVVTSFSRWLRKRTSITSDDFNARIEPIFITKDLSGFSTIWLLDSHLSMLTRSQFTEAAADAAVQSLECNSVSSAYKVQLDSFIDDETPSKWIENSDGPRTEPCGTP